MELMNTQITKSLENIRDIIEYCKRCGLCLPYCPIYEVSKRLETISPRGKLLLTFGILTRNLRIRQRTAELLFSCTLCNRCAQACPAGINISDALLHTRIMLFEKGFIPRIISKIASNMNSQKNPYGVDLSSKNFWFDFTSERIESKGNVVIWMGCTTALKQPELAAHVYEVVKRFEKSAAVIDNEPCCGIPLLYAGDLRGYYNSLKEALKAISTANANLVITPCPSCLRAFRQFPQMLNIKIPFKVMHITEYLWEKIVKRKSIRLRYDYEIFVTYHDPCELARHMNIYKEPRELLRSIVNVNLVEMNNSGANSKCCGGGGLYMGFDFDKALAIALLRLHDVPKDIEILVTACPTCESMLSAAIDSSGRTLKIIDVVDIIHEILFS